MRVLLQTTIPYAEDDWHIGRFSLLRECIAAIDGVDVVARDRTTPPGIDDPLLSKFDESTFDQLWLFAVDTGNGLTENECGAITRFAQRGGAILSTRDHQDLGCSLCTIGGVGTAHYFHTKNPEPDASRHCRDDAATLSIDWPNYHSGANGDFHPIAISGSLHPTLRRKDGSAIEFFPSHPHEGAVGAPPEAANARVIATAVSSSTGRPFNLSVAFERTATMGRAIAESSFHHFCDYNWNPSLGCPSFVEEKPGHAIVDSEQAQSDIHQYVRNVVHWLE